MKKNNNNANTKIDNIVDNKIDDEDYVSVRVKQFDKINHEKFVYDVQDCIYKEFDITLPRAKNVENIIRRFSTSNIQFDIVMFNIAIRIITIELDYLYRIEEIYDLLYSQYFKEMEVLH